MVRERGVLVVQAQQHGPAVFFREHEVEGVEAAPEREDGALAAVSPPDPGGGKVSDECDGWVEWSG